MGVGSHRAFALSFESKIEGATQDDGNRRAEADHLHLIHAERRLSLPTLRKVGVGAV